MTDSQYRQTLREIMSHLLPETYDHIKKMLASRSPIVKQLSNQLKQPKIADIAIFLIAQLGAVEFVPELIQRYKKTRSFNIRHWILYAWWRFGAKHKDELLQRMKAAAIRPFSDTQVPPFSLGPFLKIAQDIHQTTQKRAMALECLAWHGDADLLPALFSLLGDSEPKVRFAALYPIRMLGNASMSSLIEPLLSDTALAEPFGTVANEARHVLDTWAAKRT
jgi:hypothetical protein